MIKASFVLVLLSLCLLQSLALNPGYFGALTDFTSAFSPSRSRTRPSPFDDIISPSPPCYWLNSPCKSFTIPVRELWSSTLPSALSVLLLFLACLPPHRLRSRFLLLSLSFFLPSGAPANIEQYHGGTGEDVALAMSPTSDGGVYMTGYTRSMGSGGVDIWTLRLGSSGSIVWEAIAGCAGDDVGNAVETTADGGCVVAGYDSCGGSKYAYIIFYDAGGAVLNEKRVTSMTLAVSIKVLKVNSGYAIGGSYNSQYLSVVALTPSLDVKWQYTCGYLGWYSGIVERSDGVLIAVGKRPSYNTYAYARFNGATGGVIVFLLGKYPGEYTAFMVTDLLLLDGNILIVGAAITNGAGNYYIWVLKQSIDGAGIWDRIYGGTSGNYFPKAAIELSDGSIAIIGSTTYGTVGGSDIYFLLISPTGDVLKTQLFGSTGNDEGTGIVYRNSDGYFLIGGYWYVSASYGQQYYFRTAIYCPSGTVANTATVACDPCAVGYYQPEFDQTTPCIICEQGTYQNLPAQAKCVDCAAGSYQPNTGQTSCTPCAVGSAQLLTKQISCVVCEQGTYQNLPGQANCLDCAAGSYQPSTEQTACIPCAAGSVQPSTKQTSCVLCDLGTYQGAIGHSACLDCDAGTYQGSTGQTSCTPCAAGTVQPSTKQSSCLLCDVGTYQGATGQSSCIDCAAGTYQGSTGQASCTPCAAGTVQPSTKQTSCLSCGVGTYQGATGQQACIDCGVGTYSDNVGSTGCSQCVPGKHQAVTKQTACLDCELMEYQDEYGKPDCKACGVTKYQDLKGQTYCKNCLANCSLCTTATDCSQCIVDNFKLTITGVITCENPCRDRYYGDSSDSTCKPCLSNCKECADADRCNLCLLGYYRYRTSTSTVDQCVPTCPTRMYGNDTTRTCEDCISWCPDCTTSANCQRCDLGYFVDTLSVGINQCVNPCRDGYFNDPSDKCQSCLPGCKVCTNAIRCSECFEPLSLKYIKAYANDSCVYDCGSKYYSTPGRICQACDFRCLSCTDPTSSSCPDCDFGIEGVAKTGALSCDCGTGYTASLILGKCLVCEDPLCMTCNAANLTECYSCSTSVPGITYSETTKSCTCAPGKYREGNGCSSCNTLCSECTGLTNKDCVAYKCNTGYKAYALESLPTTCLYMCRVLEDNLFVNWTTKTCQACKPPCKSCYNGTVYACSSCVPGYLLLGSTCADSCPKKFYEDSGVCLPCDAKCRTCVGKTNYCVDSCESPYLFKSHRCLSDCGEGFTGVEGQCEECDTNCAICYYDKTMVRKVCTQCIGGKLLHKGTCVQLCPAGYYPDSTAGECKACSVECTKCLNAGNKACTACNTTYGYTMIAANVCDYPTCTRGTYFNITRRSCQDCRVVCSECSSYDNCSACAKGYLLNAKTSTCYDECDKVGYTRLPVTNECVEICGDGRNMGVHPCDDGNTKGGDGCSSTCQIEPNYACSGGNETNADSCVNRKQPEFVGLKYYGNRTGVVTFSAPIRFLGDVEKVVGVSLEGGDNTYVAWSYVASKKKYNKKVTLNFAFNYSLTGEEKVVVNVRDLSMVQDANGNALKYNSVRASVSKYKYVASEYLSGVSGVGTISFYAMILSVGTSLAISLIFNTPIEGMWAAMSVLQMMSYITLMTLHFPENLLTFLGYMESVHNFNGFLPNAFTFVFPSKYLNLSPYNDQFNDRGFSSRNMLYLCGSDLVMMAAMGLAILVLIPLSNVLSVFDSLLKKLRYNSLIRSFIQSYLKICLASFINVGIYSFDNPASAISSLIAIITGCLLVGTPAFISEFLYQNHELAVKDQAFKATHASYISGFRVQANVLNLMFYPIFLFRRLVFAATITLLANYPSLQLSLISLQTGAILMYMYYWKPYRSKYSLYSSLAAEFMFGCCSLIMFAFVTAKSDQTSYLVGWLIISLIVGSLVTSWICVVAQQIRIYRKRKALKEQKDAEEAKKKAAEEDPKKDNDEISNPENKAEEATLRDNNSKERTKLESKPAKTEVESGEVHEQESPQANDTTKGFKRRKASAEVQYKKRSHGPASLTQRGERELSTKDLPRRRQIDTIVKPEVLADRLRGLAGEELKEQWQYRIQLL